MNIILVVLKRSRTGGGNDKSCSSAAPIPVPPPGGNRHQVFGRPLPLHTYDGLFIGDGIDVCIERPVAFLRDHK